MAHELHRGTVTFLFTDIEGSTRLLNQLGQDRYDELLTTHQEILLAAFAAHGGRVADTQGDSFFVAFATANDAVAAAAAAQRDLAAHPWPEGAQVKVRMGLHTGEPKVGAERYVGIGVHRAARIGAAGHGGQVVLSWTTKGLAEEDLPPGVTIRDLGERRLKDIEQPQHLYQLVIDGLQNEFAQLKTLDVELARKRRRMYAGAALIGVVAAAVAIPVFALGQGSSGGVVTVQGNAVALIDPGSNRVVGQVPNVGARPASIAYGSGSLWVANLDDQTVARINPDTRTIERTVAVEDTPTGLATSPAAVWVVGSNATSASVTVRRIDPDFNTVSARTPIGNVVIGGPGSVAAAGRTVWVAPSSGLLSRLDPGNGRVVSRIDPNAGPAGVAVDASAGAVWVTGGDANTVTRIDPTGLLTPIAVGHDPSGIAVGADGVWVADTLDNAVVRIDPATRAVTTTIPVGRSPAGVAVGDSAVWVANSGDGTVTRIDPSGRRQPVQITVGGSPQGVVVEHGRVWVTVDPQTIEPLASASQGGVARLNAVSQLDSMDPALAYTPITWQLLYATCTKLVNYPDKAGPAGSQLVPEVARSLPARSADGKTYTFAIRNGFRFSPPSNQAVTAQTFKYSIERALSAQMKGGGRGYLGDVVGARAFMTGHAPHVTGIVARGDTLTVHLVSPAPDLITRLALPFFCAVPIGTPLDPKGVRAIPSAGPYFVASYTPGQGVVLKRNPNYRGSRTRDLNSLQLTIGVSAKTTDSAIEAGSVDYGLDGVDPSDADQLASRYGPGPTASARAQQYFVNPQLAVDYILLNTHRPLFHDTRLRRAVNYAIDRRTLARIGSPFAGERERPTDQYLPPGMPGFKDAHIYPFTPAVAKARRLAGGKRRVGVLYTCNQSPCDEIAQTVKTNLAAIGIDVRVRAFPISALFTRLGRPGEPFDLAVGGVGWIADYPDPDDFLNFVIGSGAGGTFAPFTDPGFQRQARAAAQLTGPSRYLAYGKFDATAARSYAPWVALANPVVRDFFSARMGCQVFSPVYGMDLAALCIRKH